MRAASIAAAGLCWVCLSVHAESIYGLETNEGPQRRLVNGPDGALYATQPYPATAFKITPSGTYTELHRFDPITEGTYPAGLMLATDGNFYGLLPYGNANDAGAVYRMTPSGQVTILSAFLPGLDYDTPIDPLVQAPDGNLYGTTLYGGANEAGTIYRVTPQGLVTVVYEFNGITDGIAPRGPLAIGNDRALYGVMNGGYGGVFRVTTSGAFTKLHQFDGFGEGSGPEAGLVRGPGGELFGVVGRGGDGGFGNLFRITTAGQFEVVHGFDFGAWRPVGNLIFGPDGNLYGVTDEGGDDDCGVLFSMTLSGVFNAFHAFSRATEGCRTLGGVTQGPDGALYGMLAGGGPHGFGSIYRVERPSGPLPPSWIQPPTPVAYERAAYVGIPTTIALRAGGRDPADVVHIAGETVPANSSLNATDGNPANATFTWTPSAPGTQYLTFTATSSVDGLSAPARSFSYYVMYKTLLDAKPALLELSPTGVHLRMKAVLTTPQGPAAGKLLKFLSSASGVLMCSATTDNAGVAACGSVQTFAKTAVRGYTVVFAGDSAYAPATASAGIIGP